MSSMVGRGRGVYDVLICKMADVNQYLELYYKQPQISIPQ
jgi:hypothetical protein